ncbi:MAG: hypothetical protein KF745_04725 [Phycisphaeraceae bacterium]|nr:hypothetical protein [Phycisphaeraceae bacterium]
MDTAHPTPRTPALTDRFEDLCARIGRPGRDAAGPPVGIRALLAAIAVGGAVFGAVMGTYLVGEAGRWPLVAYSAIKVPSLLMVTTAVCLPAFFVLNTVLGLRDDFGHAVRAVLAGQAGLALALASLSPLTRVAYESGVSHGTAQLFNAGLFVIATGVAQIVMFRHYRAIIDSNPAAATKHRTMLWAWVAMYAFTGIQTGWILRPYIGVPDMDVRFFRADAFSNAYIYFLQLVLRRGL